MVLSIDVLVKSEFLPWQKPAGWGPLWTGVPPHPGWAVGSETQTCAPRWATAAWRRLAELDPEQTESPWSSQIKLADSSRDPAQAEKQIWCLEVVLLSTDLWRKRKNSSFFQQQGGLSSLFKDERSVLSYSDFDIQGKSIGAHVVHNNVLMKVMFLTSLHSLRFTRRPSGVGKKISMKHKSNNLNK